MGTVHAFAQNPNSPARVENRGLPIGSVYRAFDSLKRDGWEGLYAAAAADAAVMCQRLNAKYPRQGKDMPIADWRRTALDQGWLAQRRQRFQDDLMDFGHIIDATACHDATIREVVAGTSARDLAKQLLAAEITVGAILNVEPENVLRGYPFASYVTPEQVAALIAEIPFSTPRRSVAIALKMTRTTPRDGGRFRRIFFSSLGITLPKE